MATRRITYQAEVFPAKKQIRPARRTRAVDIRTVAECAAEIFVLCLFVGLVPLLALIA